jgi:hypothetical protein
MSLPFEDSREEGRAVSEKSRLLGLPTRARRARCTPSCDADDHPPWGPLGGIKNLEIMSLCLREGGPTPAGVGGVLQELEDAGLLLGKHRPCWCGLDRLGPEVEKEHEYNRERRQLARRLFHRDRCSKRATGTSSDDRNVALGRVVQGVKPVKQKLKQGCPTFGGVSGCYLDLSLPRDHVGRLGGGRGSYGC